MLRFEQCRFRAAGRQVNANARDVSITRAPIFIRRSRIVANSAPASGVCPGDRGAHGVHQPERGSVENEPHLIGGRAVTRHAIRRQLGLVQLDRVRR